MVKESYEIACCSPLGSSVFIGRDYHGNWVAWEQNGAFGGIFVNRLQAIKYALSKNGDQPECIVEVSGEIKLELF